MEKFTPDPFLGRDIQILQPENGYRFSMDPFLLAAHVRPAHARKVLDIGCGCGIIPLILAHQYPLLPIMGVEIQEALFQCAQHNVHANSLSDTIHLIHADINQVQAGDIHGNPDLIVSNPPYKKEASGRHNPNFQKAVARHEITLNIHMLFSCAQRLLARQGRLYVIFPSERIPDLVTAMARYGFSPFFMRFVHIRENADAQRVILGAAKESRKPCAVSPPLFIYTAENKLTHAYVSLFKP